MPSVSSQKADLRVKERELGGRGRGLNRPGSIIPSWVKNRAAESMKGRLEKRGDSPRVIIQAGRQEEEAAKIGCSRAAEIRRSKAVEIRCSEAAENNKKNKGGKVTGPQKQGLGKLLSRKDHSRLLKSSIGAGMVLEREKERRS